MLWSTFFFYLHTNEFASIVFYLSTVMVRDKQFSSFRKGVAIDRLIGFQDLGGKDDFSTKTLENWLIKKGTCSVCCPFFFFVTKSQCFRFTGIISEKKDDDEDDDDYEDKHRTVRSSVNPDSDSD